MIGKVHVYVTQSVHGDTAFGSQAFDLFLLYGSCTDSTLSSGCFIQRDVFDAVRGKGEPTCCYIALYNYSFQGTVEYRVVNIAFLDA